MPRQVGRVSHQHIGLVDDFKGVVDDVAEISENASRLDGNEGRIGLSLRIGQGARDLRS